MGLHSEGRVAARRAGAGISRLVMHGLLAGLVLGCDNGGESLAPPAAHIVVEKSGLSFTAAGGDIDPAPASIKITNGGTGTISDLTAVVLVADPTEPAWLEVTLSGRVAPATLTIQPRSHGLCTGPRSATVYVGSATADNTPQQIAVGFSVGSFAQSAPPGVTTDNAIAMFSDRAYLMASVNPNGSSTSAWFEWGTDVSLASFSLTPQQALGTCATTRSLEFGLGGLTSGTTYYYRAAATNSAGAAKGAIKSFQTPPVSQLTAPTVTTDGAIAMWSDMAYLMASVSPNGLATTAWFEWGTDASLASFSSTPQQAVEASATIHPIEFGLKGLTAATTYYWRAAASNSAGTSKGSIKSFQTTP